MNRNTFHLYFGLGCTLVLTLITGNLFSTSMATETNYSHLENLLEAQRWQAADEETKRVMLIATRREQEGWLEPQNIERFPCDDFRLIDQLWLDHSNGRFGFSVQKQIYQSLGGTREYQAEIFYDLGEQLGWRRGGRWVDQYTFDITAPSGHLPSHGSGTWIGGSYAWFGRGTEVILKQIGNLFSRADVCGLGEQMSNF